MSSRRIEDLAADVQPLVRDFLARCEKAGINILVTCTYRSKEEQAVLYAQGRTAPGKVVTNAPPGASLHNYVENGAPASRAIDVVPMVLGKPQWSTADPVWKAIGEIGEACGLEWAGRWKRFKEFPHFQKTSKK